MTSSSPNSVTDHTAPPAVAMNIERYLRLVAGIVALVSAGLTHWVSPWFFLLTAFVGANLLQSAFTQWCPMVAILRALGVPDDRTLEEPRGAEPP